MDVHVDKIVRLGSRSSSERIQKVLMPNKLEDDTYKASLYDLRKGKRELAEKFEREKLNIPSKKSVASWENVSSLLNQFFPFTFSQSMEDYHDEQKDFTMVGKKGKTSKNPWETWLYHKSPKKVKSNRDLEELFATLDDPWTLSDLEKETIKNFVNDSLLEEAFTGICDINSAFKSYKSSDDAIYNDKRYQYLKSKNIIGMTTTGAAMNHELINRLRPRVILCEEAGEVLEAHSLSFFNPDLSHLILIGDHLQLRPQISEYDLSVESKSGKKYSFDISQFERMQFPEYRYPLVTLNTQRRMRPEISQLIRSTIYPELEDSPSVKNHPNILGMMKNVFFLNHKNCEDAIANSFEGSHRNTWEATFCASLVKHFLNQGYDPKNITILTPYLGQLMIIKQKLSELNLHVQIDEKDLKELKKNEHLVDSTDKSDTLPDESVNEDDTIIDGSSYSMKLFNLKDCIRVSTVDNYQGEENKIILVSLVRNCGNGDIEKASAGFLANKNRLNVLLSRAKDGMYLLGHRELLASKSTTWSQVLNVLESNNSIGDSFPMCCQLHPEYEQSVKDQTELSIYFPDGGCTRSCNKRLPCGHTCTRLCHSDDPNHIAVFCPNDCLRIRETCNHPCPKRCGDNCGPCHVVMPDYTFSSCNHVFESPKCHQVPKLNDGLIKCMKIVSKSLSCGHENSTQCYKELNQIQCKHKCEFILECGHICQELCHSGSPQHTTKCGIKCKKPLFCGHECQADCHDENCPPCKQNCEMMKCSHSKCDHPCFTSCRPCIEDCTWECEHVGSCPLPCGAPCIRIPCDKRCAKNLECGHQCPSICGEPCPDTKFCKECCKDPSILETVVDLIMFSQYQDTDIDATPIIILDCGHFKTVETLDGIFSIHKFYLKDENEQWRSDQFPRQETDIIPPPACPDCRMPITSIKRYGRIIRSAQLDQSEKRYIVQVHREMSAISTLMELPKENSLLLQKSLRHLKLIGKTPSEQLLDSCTVSLQQTPHFYEMYSPFLNVPKPHYGIRARIVLILSQCERMLMDKKLKSVRLFEKKFNTLSELISKGIESAKMSDSLKLENEITLEAIQWKICRLKLFDKTNFKDDVSKLLKNDNLDNLADALKEMADSIKIDLIRLIETAAPSFQSSASYDSLQKLKSSMENYISLGYFESEIDYKEAYEVFKALTDSRDFSGAGHFYRCPNGHIYIIGNCGMAMESSNCPECGERVGGSQHTLLSNNSAATDLESVLFQMDRNAR